MKSQLFLILVCIFFAVSCSKPAPPPAPVPETGPPAASTPAPTPGTPPPAQNAIERPPIDLGDVDSGVFIRGLLAPESEAPNVTAEYIETLRGNLSMTTITVKEPFPEAVYVRFEFAVRRAFEERPVVIRARAYRGENDLLSGDYACVLGKDALQLPLDANGTPTPRSYTVNVLEGLDAPPETILVHGRADAWLMPAGTMEMLLDPRVADSSEKVVLMGNPVRINFVKEDAAS